MFTKKCFLLKNIRLFKLLYYNRTAICDFYLNIGYKNVSPIDHARSRVDSVVLVFAIHKKRL